MKNCRKMGNYLLEILGKTTERTKIEELQINLKKKIKKNISFRR